MAIRFLFVFTLASFLHMWGSLAVPLSKKFGDFEESSETIIIIPEISPQEVSNPLPTITKETDPFTTKSTEETTSKTKKTLSATDSSTLSNDELITKESTVDSPITSHSVGATELSTTQESQVDEETDDAALIFIPEISTQEASNPSPTIILTKETDPTTSKTTEETTIKTQETLSEADSRTLSNGEHITKKSTVDIPITSPSIESTEESTQESEVDEKSKETVDTISEKNKTDSELSGCPSECPIEETNNICTNIGIVYESECEMKKENCGKDVYPVDWENCRGKHPLCPDNCLLIYDPVCGHDGRVYTNLCVFHSSNCGQTIIIHEMQFCLTKAREFRDVDACPRQCQEIYEPACGSDGQVYMNECFLRLYNCGKKVDLVDMDKCVDAPECPNTCTSIYDPVCGSDGKIYLNHCRFIRDNCGKNVEKRPRSFCEEKMIVDQKNLDEE